MLSVSTYARLWNVHRSTALRWLRDALGHELERGARRDVSAVCLPAAVEVHRLPGGHYRIRVDKKVMQTRANEGERA